MRIQTAGLDIKKENEMNTELVKQGESPAEMIRVAVAGGADLEKLKGLLDLQIKWEENEARKAFHKAMSEFKANPPEIEKDRDVCFGNTKFSHASLANVVRTITKELSKHGLSASWRTAQNGTIAVTCKITHVLGHSEETTLSAPSDTSGSKNAIQAIGSTISYLERYSLLAVLGLATSEMDDDGKASEPVINDKQLSMILDLLAAKELPEKGLLDYMKVGKLEDIKAADYQKAINAIDVAKKVVK